MIEITLKQNEDFLKVKETLTRMGIANNKTKTLYQSCHILQKQGNYFIVHFKELLKLDGRVVDITDEDITRRDNMACLLEEWGLCDILADEDFLRTTPENNFRIIPHKVKDEWKLIHKYAIGN